jgi:hypothetical protein
MTDRGFSIWLYIDSIRTSPDTSSAIYFRGNFIDRVAWYEFSERNLALELSCLTANDEEFNAMLRLELK